MNKSILKFKGVIKQMAVQQVSLKNQRKTVKREGKCVIHPDTAVEMHADNRFRLRHMYIAYGFIRGKTFEQIESNAKTNYSKDAVSKLVEKYSPEAVRISA